MDRCNSRGGRPIFSARLGGQGLLARFPDRHRTLHAHHILQAECSESIAKVGIHAVGGVGRHHATGQICRDRRADLIQGDVRLGLKLDLFRHLRLFAPLGICGPFFRQI